MIKIGATFLIVWLIIVASVLFIRDMWQTTTGKEKVKAAKVIALCTVAAVMTTAVLSAIVIVF